MQPLACTILFAKQCITFSDQVVLGPTNPKPKKRCSDFAPAFCRKRSSFFAPGPEACTYKDDPTNLRCFFFKPNVLFHFLISGLPSRRFGRHGSRSTGISRLRGWDVLKVCPTQAFARLTCLPVFWRCVDHLLHVDGGAGQQPLC